MVLALSRPFTLVSWNVNSIRRRLDQFTQLVNRWEPDVLCLQELKAAADDLPIEAFRAAGFTHCAVSAQAGYNGVAILSRHSISGVEKFFWANSADARHVYARVYREGFGDFVNGIGVHCIYAPAGGNVPDRVVNPKFDFKLRYFDALADHFSGCYGFRDPMVLAGDLNVAPLPADVWDHAKLKKAITHTEIEVSALERLKRSLNWMDTQRQASEYDDPVFTWWSYRTADWEKFNKGRRLDHIWVTPGLKDYVASVDVLTSVRHWQPPSDHAPVLLTLSPS